MAAPRPSLPGRSSVGIDHVLAGRRCAGYPILYDYLLPVTEPYLCEREGALIAVFVLILFLRDLRAGLIVAPAIPLAMLFAISIMNIFSVSNLMRGGIKSGLTADGAVIITEATLRHLGLVGRARPAQEQMNDKAYESASRIRASAVFSEIITLIALIGLGGLWSPSVQAQVTAQPGVAQAGNGSGLSLAQALTQASATNPLLRVSQLNIGYQQSLRGTAGDVGKTDVAITIGQYNSRYFDQSFTVGQRFPNPALVRGLRSLADARTAGAEAEGRLTRTELARQVKATYYQLWYVQSLAGFLRSQDSLYAAIARGAEVRRRTGEGTLLEQTAADVQRKQAQTTLSQNALDARILARQLQTLLASPVPPTIPDTLLTERTMPVIDSLLLTQSPELAQLSSQIEVARRETDLEAARLKPDFVVSLTNQSLRGVQVLPNGEGERVYDFGDRFTYGQIGLSIPVFAKPLKARVAAARIGQDRAEAQRLARQRTLEGEVATILQTYQKNRQALAYYRESALPQAALIREQVTKSYRAGEIGYIELLQNLRTVSEIQTGYLASLNDLNQTLINLDFLLGRTD